MTKYGEKRFETKKNITNYDKDYCCHKRKPKRNEDHKRRVNSKNDDIAMKRADYSGESNNRNLKY